MGFLVLGDSAIVRTERIRGWKISVNAEAWGGICSPSLLNDPTSVWKVCFRRGNCWEQTESRGSRISTNCRTSGRQVERFSRRKGVKKIPGDQSITHRSILGLNRCVRGDCSPHQIGRTDWARDNGMGAHAGYYGSGSSSPLPRVHLASQP